jgi:hypothetical protein
MAIAVYLNEYEGLSYIICAKCGRYVKINDNCECEIFDSVRKNGLSKS